MSVADAEVQIARPFSNLGTAGPILLILPLAALTAIFFVAPLVLFAIYSFLTAGLFSVSLPFTLDAYRAALSSSLNWRLAVNSIAIGSMTAAISTSLGLSVAYWLRYRAGRLQLPVLFLITASVFASYLVRIYAWRTILGSSGVINRSLMQLAIIEEPMTFLLYNWFSVVIALVHIFLPYTVLVLFAAFRPLEAHYLDAAQDLGANSAMRWRRVILPLMAQPLAIVFLFVFVLAASDYVTPQLIGGTGGQMLGVQIQSNFKAIGNWPVGAATSILALVGFVLCFFAIQISVHKSGMARIRWST
jgi:spermidine/putrescine transport system permease protein